MKHEWVLIAHVPLTARQVEMMLDGKDVIPSEWNHENTRYYGPGCARCNLDWHAARTQACVPVAQ